MSTNFYHHRHKDFLQRIDVSTSPDNIKSAAGNIGTGDMYVFEIKGSVRLTRFGMPNVLFNTQPERKIPGLRTRFSISPGALIIITAANLIGAFATTFRNGV